MSTERDRYGLFAPDGRYLCSPVTYAVERVALSGHPLRGPAENPTGNAYDPDMYELRARFRDRAWGGSRSAQAREARACALITMAERRRVGRVDTDGAGS